MTELQNIGTKGEGLAVEYLINKNYKILKQNWRNNHLEVDIIAIDKAFIVFIEVKTRSSNYLVSPEAAVDRNKQKLLIRAANSYILQNNIKQEARFDIVTIIIDKANNVKIDHIEDAFSPIIR